MSANGKAKLTLAELVAKYTLSMTLTPDDAGTLEDIAAIGGRGYRVEVTALDPNTRLRRAGTAWWWDAPADDGAQPPERTGRADADLSQAIMSRLAFQCGNIDAGDVFDFIFTQDVCDFTAAGQADSAPILRAAYEYHLALREQMHLLFGKVGYCEFTAR